jgi:hypothetical protein
MSGEQRMCRVRKEHMWSLPTLQKGRNWPDLPTHHTRISHLCHRDTQGAWPFLVQCADPEKAAICPDCPDLTRGN